MKKLVLGAALPFAAIAMLGASYAQDLTLGEQSIPADQVTVVEDWCKELQAQQGLTGTQEPESTMTEEQADAATGGQGEASEGSIDLTTITLEQCQEAGLTDQEGD